MKISSGLAISSLALLCLTSTAANAADIEMAAIVPGTDIIGTIDLRSLNAAPLVKNHSGKKAHALTRDVAARSARFEAATGLTKKDVISIIFSCNLNTYNFKGVTKRDKSAKLSGLIAVKLAKPVTIAKIKQAIKLEYGSEDLAGVADITISGYPALLIKAPSKSDPDIFITVSPDKHLFLAALNAGSLTSALQRIKSGRMIKEPAPLARIRKALPPRSQIKAAAIIPPQVRALISQQSKAMYKKTKQDPRMVAAASVTKLFENLKSASLGIQLTNDALITIAGDMGNAQYSKQAGILLKSMVIPMMQATMMQQNPQDIPIVNLEKQVKVKSDGTDLFLQILVPQTQIFPKPANRYKTHHRENTQRPAAEF